MKSSADKTRLLKERMYGNPLTFTLYLLPSKHRTVTVIDLFNPFKMSYAWVKCWSGSEFPESAIEGGHDIDGTIIYVGRALHCGEVIPAKVMPEKGVAYVCHDGQEVMVHDYEVLTLSPALHWETACEGSVPAGAVVAGNTKDGEALYVGRVFYENAMTIGKVHPSHGCLYIAFDSTEMSFNVYEVLVYS